MFEKLLPFVTNFVHFLANHVVGLSCSHTSIYQTRNQYLLHYIFLFCFRLIIPFDRNPSPTSPHPLLTFIYDCMQITHCHTIVPLHYYPSMQTVTLVDLMTIKYDDLKHGFNIKRAWK